MVSADRKGLMEDSRLQLDPAMKMLRGVNIMKSCIPGKGKNREGEEQKMT